MSERLTERQQRVLENARRNVKTRAMAKSLAARKVQHNPRAEQPRPEHQYLAIADEGSFRGMRSVPKGDGSSIEFKDAQYATNDPSEAALLADTPGIVVKKLDTYKRSVFAVPALPWKDK